jgi:phosphatidylglycerophosphate synthase
MLESGDVEIIMKGNGDSSLYDGTKVVNDSFLSKFNRQFIEMALPLVPKWLQTYHLTAVTYVLAALCVLSGYLARANSQWLWIIAVSLFCHYVTDALDGEVGRRRKTGLARWGFYVDHFGDFIFSLCILIGLSYSTPPSCSRLWLIMMGAWSAFFLNAYMLWILNKRYTISFFKVSGIEAHFVLGLLVICFAVLGPKALTLALRIAVPAAILGLAIVFFSIQRQLWRQDKIRKKKKK